MVFVVHVATDLFGRKSNVKLEFPTCPTMAELINATESHYDIEVRSHRPAGYPDCPYKVQTFQVYDDVLLRWVDLYSSSQLMNCCQIFAFQPESIWHSDAQGIIPEPKNSITWMTSAGSPRRNRGSTDAGVAPSLSEKLRAVFYDVDIGNKGYILYSDLRAAFQKCDIEITQATAGELFVIGDANCSGHITYDEWVRFAIHYPNIIDALFFRLRDAGLDQNMHHHHHHNGCCVPQPQPAHPQYPVQQHYLPHPQPAHHSPQMAAAGPPMMQQPGTPAPSQYYSQPHSYSASPQGDIRSEYEQARREAEMARYNKEMAESKERELWERMHSTAPTNPTMHY